MPDLDPASPCPAGAAELAAVAAARRRPRVRERFFGDLNTRMMTPKPHARRRNNAIDGSHLDGKLALSGGCLLMGRTNSIALEVLDHHRSSSPFRSHSDGQNLKSYELGYQACRRNTAEASLRRNSLFRHAEVCNSHQPNTTTHGTSAARPCDQVRREKKGLLPSSRRHAIHTRLAARQCFIASAGNGRPDYGVCRCSCYHHYSIIVHLIPCHFTQRTPHTGEKERERERKRENLDGEGGENGTIRR